MILNSDQGWQFASTEYLTFLKENYIYKSTNGKSCSADNIMIQRWFHSFKYEKTYLTQYVNFLKAPTAIRGYVHTYNFKCCHSSINNQISVSYHYTVLQINHAA